MTAKWSDGGLYTIRDMRTHPEGMQYHAVEVLFSIWNWEADGGCREAD